jgi:pterin-4a-carbinolamine dehydratase
VATTAADRRLPIPPGWRQEIAAAAQDHFRRPDMCVLEFNHVRLTINNPNRAGITEAELRLAAKVNAVVDR